MLTRRPYDELYARFRWDLPAAMNMAHQACDGWAATEPDRIAIIDLSGGIRREVTYQQLWHLSRRVEAALMQKGIRPTDRVGVLLSQRPLCAAAHLACWRMGAVSVPLFKLFGREALLARLEDAGAGVVVTDQEGQKTLHGSGLGCITRAGLPQAATASSAAPEFDPDHPAVLIYTSGTTGAPKGALHGHRVLTGHLPGVEMSHDYLGQRGDVIWTPADWAWIGGLFDVLMPGLALGVPVVAARLPKFTALDAARICTEGRVRNVFFPPTVLRMLRAADITIPGLRSVASGGEPLGAEMLAWGEQALGVSINEFYGQTECNMIASSSSEMFPARPGSIGRAVPGHKLAVLDDDGQPTTQEGDIAVARGSASMMLEYWRKPKETQAKFKGRWMLTGDRGVWDGTHLRFLGRADDVITSGGYRIGPSEIEDCLTSHPSVVAAGVVGKPDALRGHIVKAYVVLADDVIGTDALVEALQALVRDRVSAHVYPREIGFLDALPMTVTGKVIRHELRARAAQE